MTPEHTKQARIKELAKQAGAKLVNPENRRSAHHVFRRAELAEFVRLIRQQAFEEALQAVIDRVGDSTEGRWAQEVIWSLK